MALAPTVGNCRNKTEESGGRCLQRGRDGLILGLVKEGGEMAMLTSSWLGFGHPSRHTSGGRSGTVPKRPMKGDPPDEGTGSSN